jgi:hypothetical protein
MSSPDPFLLPGQFAIQTFLSETFLTAVAGGGRIANAVHANGTVVGPTEKFRLWASSTRQHTPENPEGFLQYAIQTENGTYITAVSGGGRSSDVLHTDAAQPSKWEQFGLIPQVSQPSIYPSYYDMRHSSPWYYAIATNTGNYLTALGGGGHTDPSMHSDATKIGAWELFRLIKCGELMSGYQYAIRRIEGLTMGAEGGGGKFTHGLVLGYSMSVEADSVEKFRLIEQTDGSYAIQTPSGNYVTAVAGGGIPALDKELGSAADVFHTNAVQVQSWEKFRILDQGDGTYVIRTNSGWYIGTDDSANLRTDIEGVENATKFRISPLFDENRVLP